MLEEKFNNVHSTADLGAFRALKLKNIKNFIIETKYRPSKHLGVQSQQ